MQHKAKKTVATISDEQLDHWSNVYNASAKLKANLRFDQFISDPYGHVAASELWPSEVWAIDFIKSGSHHKMWVICAHTMVAIDVPIIRKDEPLEVAYKLGQLVEKKGKPDAIQIIDTTDDLTTALRGWCFVHQVDIEPVPVRQKSRAEGAIGRLHRKGAQTAQAGART